MHTRTKKLFKKISFDPTAEKHLIIATVIVLIIGFAGGVWFEKKDPTLLLTQQALTGSFRPVADGSDTYTLTFIGVKPHTLVYADSPEHVVGSWTNTDFVARWQTNADSFAKDPPNAVLLSHSPVDGKEYSIEVELMNPVFNAFAGTLTYTATVVNDGDADDGLVPSADRHMEEFPEILRSPALFIDNGGCDADHFMGTSFSC